MKVLLGRTKEFLEQAIFPHISAFRAQRVLQNKIRRLECKEFSILPNRGKDRSALIGELEDYNDRERKRKDIVEDKAKASLFIITLSATLILASLAFLKDVVGALNPTFTLILILGVLYLLSSGITSIEALNIRKSYDMYIDYYIEESGSKLSILNPNPEDVITRFYQIIKLNELITNIRSNFVYATFAGIRNGVILITLFFTIAVGNIYIADHSGQTQQAVAAETSESSAVEGDQRGPERMGPAH